MKLQVVFVLISINAIVKGVIWGAAAVEPVIQMLGLGSIFAAWNIAKKPNDYVYNFSKKEKNTPLDDA